MNMFTSPTALLPALDHISLEFDATERTFWALMHASAAQQERPCCSLPIIEDGIAIQEFVANYAANTRDGRSYLVLGSQSKAYSLGGDLALFVRCIREQDRETLLKYALRCVDAVHGFQDVAPSVHTIALIQGDALGGGLEVALSCNTIIAERNAMLGFPEVLFNLFPGMGAYSLLCRRMPAQQAKRMVLDGNLWTAEEMHARGVVDVLVEPGQGPAAVRELVRRQRNAGRAADVVDGIHARASKVPLEELQDITTRWVDAAMQLEDRSLKVIERILRAQAKNFACGEGEARLAKAS